MEEKKINKSIAFSIVAVLLLVIVVAGSTYAYFRAAGETDVQEITTANLTMGFEAGEWVRADEKMMPISDAEINTKAVELPFTITNTGDEHMNVTIKLTNITMSDELKDVDFRWGLFNAETGNALSRGIFTDVGSATELTIYTDHIIDAAEPDITRSYVLRLWIHDDGAAQDSLMGRTFSARVKVTGEAVEYTDESCFTFSNGAITAYADGVEGCPSDVVIPKTIGGVAVTTIGGNSKFDNIFHYSNVGPTSIILPDTITTIHEASLGYVFLYSITIPEGVTIISGANNGGTTTLPGGLKQLFLPDTVTTIGDRAFDGTSLSSVVIPYGVKTVRLDNTQIENIIILDGATTIKDMAFMDNTDLTTIEIPASVTTIGSDAFSGCSSLTKVVVRGKSSIEEFTGGYAGLTTEGGLPEGVTIEFRP